MWTQVASILPASKQAGWDTPLGHCGKLLICTVTIGVYKKHLHVAEIENQYPEKGYFKRYLIVRNHITSKAPPVLYIAQYGQNYPINIGMLVGVN